MSVAIDAGTVESDVKSTFDQEFDNHGEVDESSSDHVDETDPAKTCATTAGYSTYCG